MNTAAVLKHAIANRLQVTAVYDGYKREFCPHAIGWKRAKHADDDEYHVLVYQFGGYTSRGRVSSGGQWKCFAVDKLEDLTSRLGKWHTAPVASRSHCIDLDRVELEAS